MTERWADIKGFSDYAVSDHGNIYSKRRLLQLLPNQNAGGVLKVNLTIGGKVHTRSVARLVAEAFLPSPDDVAMKPIHLDGNQHNNHYLNLEWRPHWFAWKYARQFTTRVPREYDAAVLNIHTGNKYNTIVEAGIDDGVLWEYVYQSAVTGRPVYPTGAVYQFL